MQHVIVALVLGIKRKGWAVLIGTGHLVPNCLRVFPPVSFDHSIFLVPECSGDPPEYRIRVLRLTEVQQGCQYVD
jgi:hypothetical protein